MIATVLFDFDGTLVHTAPGILAGFSKVLAEAGVVTVEAIDERVIGPPLRATLQRLTGTDDPARIERLARAFTTTYDADGVQLADPYAGLHDVLAQMAKDGRRMFIVTNKRHRAATVIAERLEIAPYFTKLYSLDSLDPPAERKQMVVAHVLAYHGLEADRTVMVGDSAEDAQSAAANGVPFIAATYGYGSPAAFTDVAPVATLDRLADLPAVLARLDR